MTKATKNAITAAAVGAAGWVLFKLFSDYRQDAAVSDWQNDAEAQQAINFLKGMNPSGFPLLAPFDGTDEQLIFDTAQAVTDFARVQEKYRLITKGRNLVVDLQQELTAAELSTLQAILQGGREAEALSPRNLLEAGAGMVSSRPDISVFLAPSVDAREAFKVSVQGAYLGDFDGTLHEGPQGNKFVKGYYKSMPVFYMLSDVTML